MILLPAVPIQAFRVFCALAAVGGFPKWGNNDSRVMAKTMTMMMPLITCNIHMEENFFLTFMMTTDDDDDDNETIMMTMMTMMTMMRTEG